MARKKLAEPAHIQLHAENCLFFAACFLGAFHMLLSVFRYAIDYTSFQPYERWYALLLLFAVLVYLLITLIRFPNTSYRLKAFFAGMRSYEQLFMFALFFWFVIVCIIRQKTDPFPYFKVLDWWLLDTAVLSFVLFPLAYYAGKEKAMKASDFMLHIVVLPYSVFVGWCLWNVFRLTVITLPSGSQVGMTSDYQLVLGVHYNITGAISFTLFTISCYMIATQKPVLKVVYGIAAIVHLCISLLSNSRTVFVSLLFFATFSLFFFCWHLLRDKKGARKWIVCAGAAIAGFALIWCLRSLSFVWFDAATGFSSQISENSGQIIESAEQATESVAQTAARELTDMSGRRSFWMAALKVMISGPRAFFFGVTPSGASEALQKIGGITFDIAHAHNEILQFGVSFGVPAMIAYIVFIIKNLINCAKSLLRTDGKSYLDYIIVSTALPSLVVMNLAEAYLTAYFSVMSCVFFLFCGLNTYSVLTPRSVKR